MKRTVVRRMALLATIAFAVVAVTPVGPGTTGCVTVTHIKCGPGNEH